jgi:radical SAM protein with 4Fe4S-binding SPASM domain
MPDGLVQGELRQHDLWDIWFHPDSFGNNRNFSPEVLDPGCVGCDRVEECLGACSAMSLGAPGRIHNDPYCLYGIR